jgi:hypothetical protein
MFGSAKARRILPRLSGRTSYLRTKEHKSGAISYSDAFRFISICKVDRPSAEAVAAAGLRKTYFAQADTQGSGADMVAPPAPVALRPIYFARESLMRSFMRRGVTRISNSLSVEFLFLVPNA